MQLNVYQYNQFHLNNKGWLMKRLFMTGCISLVVLSGCGGNSTLEKPKLEGKPEIVATIESHWDQLLDRCPALNKYSEDLTFAGLSDFTYLDGAMSRVEINYKVSKDPNVIPNSYNAWGHTCAFGISPDGKTLRIQKEVCVSVCLGKKHQGSGSDYLVSL